MLATIKAAIVALVLLALVAWQRCRSAVGKAVLAWVHGGEARYVARNGKYVRTRFVRPGELCACDVTTSNGCVLRTLSRGMLPVDIEDDTRRMKLFRDRVLAVDPATAFAHKDAVVKARAFLMERCGGYGGTHATVFEVVRLMESSLAMPCVFDDKLTVLFADFEQLELVGSDHVSACMQPVSAR